MDNTNTHTDSRGTIKDLLVTDEYSITYVTFNEGAVRGNHYHKETLQFDQVLKGKLLFSKNGEETIVDVMDITKSDKNDKHAYKALEPSEIVSICFGKRIGSHYEEDTYRLSDDEKLIK